MRCRERKKRAGEVYPVQQSYHYPLPRGLEPGTLVKLMAHDHGYWIVEANGERYRVFQSLVCSGFDYEIGGRWYPADHSAVIARMREEKLVRFRPFGVCREGVNPPV